MKKIFFALFLMAQNVWAQTDSSSATIVMEPKQQNLNEVQISATRAGANTPTAFQTISKEELQKNNLGQDLPYLLDNTPSVVTTSDAGTGIGYTGIRIRGSDATRVNVTLNGIPVNDAESQAVYWVDIPDVVSSAQSVQLQRGVGSSTNGGSAFGGTLSMQTQTPAQRAYGEASVSGGSFNTFKINGKAGTGIHKGFFAEGSASMINSDGYIDRAYAKLASWFLQTGYMNNNTMVKLLYFGGREKTYQAWDGVPQDSLKTNRTFNDLGTDYGQHFPPYKNQTDNYGQDYLQLLFSQYLPKGFNLNAAFFATLGKGYYEEYKAAQDINSYFPNFDTVPVITDLVRQKWLKNIFYGGTFAVNYNRKDFSATLGGALCRYDAENFGKVISTAVPLMFDNTAKYYYGQSAKNDFNVYIKLNYELRSRLHLFLDVQYRYVGYQTKGTDDGLNPYDAKYNWNFFNPKFGVLYKIKPAHQIYASYAMGSREPNRDDVLAALAANKFVKPEKLQDVEAGYKFLHPQFPLNINLYFMDYKDQLVLTGRLNDVGNPIKENVAKSYRAGIELNGSFHVYRHWGTAEAWHNRKVFSINYSFTYSLNKIKSFYEYIYTYDDSYAPVDSFTQVIKHKNSNISFSPNIIASLELAAYPFEGFEISLINKAVSKQYLDNTSNEDRKIKPFFYSNLRLTYKLPLHREHKEIKLTLLLNNIFNRLYESNGYTYSERYYSGGSLTPVSTYNYYNPQAGFNILGGISVRF